MLKEWLAIGYLSGCLLFGLWLPRLFNKGDPRKVGSGNIGATNIGRMSGPRWAFIIFFLDMLKAYIPCAFFLHLHPQNPEHALMVGFMVMLGHVLPITGKFKGGKAVSCFFGVLLVASWPLFIVSSVLWLLLWKKTHYSSLASMISISCACFWLVFQFPLFALFSLALVFSAHLPNLRRLLKGTETRI
jgi:acyl phosphate:glycerol-3-phosphate acyltransferase